ncbi:acyl carrier protein [Actinomadura fibrosa]|uniref:Acyl carrier protein n=1 Tax=Actinomadura fibrosa TaxID=111802 RepID=A0ABW2XTX1_9ACTN|nr:acyl carrier protein [Actinomadura fibrosa]
MTQPTTGETARLDEAELRALVADALELPVADVTDDAEFVEELGVDSLMIMEIMVRVEQRYGVQVEDEEFTDVRTFVHVRDLLAGKLAAA